jgi:hypothetical protein
MATRDWVYNQHYNPRLHLKRWGSSTGVVHVFDKVVRKQFSRHINDVCSAFEFYDDSEVDRIIAQPQAFDQFFTDFEKAGARVLEETVQSICAGTFAVLSESARAELAIYLGVQELRTKRARIAAGDLMADSIRRQFLAHIRHTQPDLPIEESWIDIDVDERAKLAAQLHLVTNEEIRTSMSTVFLERNWLFLHDATAEKFYTSDHPIVDHGEVTLTGVSLACTLALRAASTFGKEGRFKTLLPELLVNVFAVGPIAAFPLAPSVLLVMLDRTKYANGASLDGHLQNMSNPGDLEFYNGLQVRQSHRQVYSCDGNFDTAARLAP